MRHYSRRHAILKNTRRIKFYGINPQRRLEVVEGLHANLGIIISKKSIGIRFTKLAEGHYALDLWFITLFFAWRKII